MAGFKHVALVERNRHACSSLRKNFVPELVHEQDIREFDLSSIRAVDLVAGGPPCQPFSLGGKHKGLNDERDMFPVAAKVIEHLKPQVFVFENVKGLTRASFRDYFQYIILRLSYPSYSSKGLPWRDHLEKLQELAKCGTSELSYKVDFKLLNAANWGVPQSRQRVFIVGIRSDLNVQWKFPEPTHSKDRLLYDLFVTEEYWKRHKISSKLKDQFRASLVKSGSVVARDYALFPPEMKPWSTIRDAIRSLPCPKSKHGLQDHLFRPGAKSYPGHTGSAIDWPSKTIKAGDHGVPGGENCILFPDGSIRYLTVREAKLVQAFPADFRIDGSWGEAMRQIGNAVPVALARVIGESIQAALASVKACPKAERILVGTDVS